MYNFRGRAVDAMARRMLLPWRCQRVAACAAAGTASTGTSPFDNIEVEKPATDYRQYRTARLANNLHVMIVSDAKCDRAAAALSVQVGSIFDPREVPGLAHFCEHMLFLGTDKYPKEDEYNKYLAMNGGESNAYTAETVTNYFFGVKPEALDGALDRFSQFFISPLFTESATDRELQAVDSEHSKNLQADGWRQSQLLRNSVNPEHPLHHFMTGNSTTLRDEPSQNGVDVRAALLDFHSRYYSANIMKLVVVGRENPEDLLAMTRKHFSPILDSGAVVPRNEEIGNGVVAFPSERIGRMVRVVPINDIKSATFQFVMPGQKTLWRSKPTNYLSHLLGHEGKGSLTSALKKHGLVTELFAGGALEEAGVHIFAVTVMLTDAGEADVELVGDLIFAYIKLLREAGPDERLWREMQSLSDIGFRFRSLSDSMSTASGLAHSLQEHDPEVALSAGSRLWDYEPGRITEMLGLLTCDRLRLVLASKSHGDQCNSEERWYGTKYSDEPLSAELKARWQTTKGFSDLTLPTPNVFVPENLDLRPPSKNAHPATPVPLSLGVGGNATSSDLVERVTTAYFRKDEEYGLPKATCAIQIYCPFTAESLENRTLGELWCLAVVEELNEFAYEAQMAGLSYALQTTANGLTLSVGGYNDKLPALLAAVAEKMAGMSDVQAQTWEITKAVLERNLVNAAARSSPYHQAFMFEHCMLHTPSYSHHERLDALRDVGGRERLTGINRKLLDRCHMECLLQGNLTEDEARLLVRSFVTPLGVQQSLDDVPSSATAALPHGWTLIERQGTNPGEKNGAVVVTLQAAEYSIPSHCLAALAGQVLGQRFFDELRTKQQLGYIVSASAYTERYGFVGMRFIVQSEKAPAEVADRVRSWTEGAWTHLQENLTDVEFAEYRSALLAQLRERPKSLSEEFGRNWSEVALRSLSFQHREALASHLEGVTLADVQRFCAESLRNAPASCILISGSGGDPSSTSDLACDRRWTSEDIVEFRKDAHWRFRRTEISRRSSQISSRL